MSTSSNKYPLIIVAGNMSVGKTTLTNLLAKELEFQTLVENFADNPYLADFYADMRRWAFLSQMHFLNERRKQVDQINKRTSPLVLDRSVYEDYAIFATNLYRKGFISRENFQTYKIVYKRIVAALPAPTLFIFLSASVDSLVERTKKRGREFEDTIDVNYLQELNELYERWAKKLKTSFPGTTIMRVETDNFNYADDPKQAQMIVNQIKKAL